MAKTDELFTQAQEHHRKGQLMQAERLYRQVMLADRNHPAAVHYLGLIAHQTGHRQAAEGLMRRAITLDPKPAVFHANLGVVLQAGGKSKEALEAFNKALKIDPRLDDAHSNLGNLLLEMGRADEAIESFHEAQRLNPANASAHYNLANVLRDRGQLDMAASLFRRTLEINPRHLDALTNLGVVLKNQGHFDEAVGLYERALHIKTDHLIARFNLGLVHLLQGDLPGGWPSYEYRWERSGIPRPHHGQPRWDGGSLEGKTILLYGEQGLGDTIQFVRYAPLVKQRGGTVLVECQPALMDLLASVEGIDRLVPQGNTLPPFDVHAALMSLPLLFGTTLDTIPAQVPYVGVDPQRVERWRDELKVPDGFKVGIAWQGNPTFPDDRWRSIPLTQFEPLAKVKGVRLVSLQKNAGSEQLKALAGKFAVHELSDRRDLADTAAVMKNLDLVVTSDSAVAHLAGALGVPVWTMLGFVPDWRWLLNREDSPWYPTMRLFRQRKPGEWTDVFKRAATELRRLAPSRAGK